MLSVYVSHDVSIVEHHDGGSFSICTFVAQIHHKLKGLFRNADGHF